MEEPEPIGEVPGPEPTDPPRPRRRGRTAALIAGAAVLGLVAGTCAGYLVQADREPTKLPSLSQPKLTQAKGAAPQPLSAARDRRVRTDGDLRKLLLKKPRGAKAADWLTGDDGWMDMAAYAETFEEPVGAFGELVSNEFRRAAVVGWLDDDTAVEIRLLQYRQEESGGAAERTEGGKYWADLEDGDSWVVPGTEDGMAYAYEDAESEPGYVPVYTAEAMAWRGDIAMEIFVSDTRPISKKTIMSLAQRQMERL
ncbi:hypothetical protein [Streptomyces sp. NPDC056464]|uniref:hypothetical protein n=1 Tax=Streptomyces sp. NPDC056464 TaxID=3345828 RepID=UPI00369B67E4